MPIILTSAQEAAFNAAGEALTDLGVRINFGHIDHRAHEPFAAWCDHPKRKAYGLQTIWGYGATMAEAVRNMLAQRDEAEKAPMPCENAREAKDAAAAIIEEYRGKDVSVDEIADRIAAIPVAK